MGTGTYQPSNYLMHRTVLIILDSPCYWLVRGFFEEHNDSILYDVESSEAGWIDSQVSAKIVRETQLFNNSCLVIECSAHFVGVREIRKEIWTLLQVTRHTGASVPIIKSPSRDFWLDGKCNSYPIITWLTWELRVLITLNRPGKISPFKR